MLNGSINICVSPQPDVLQQRAVSDLQAYLQQLFQVHARVTDQPVVNSQVRFVIGLVSDRHVRKVASELPTLSTQGHVVRKISPKTMVLVGGSSAAVAWAVYELVEQYGVRYLLHGDVLPEKTGSFYLPDIDAIFEPVQEIRSWRQFNQLPHGPEVWSLECQERFINQLFKLKFNSIELNVWTHQPVVEFHAGGIRQQSGHMLLGFEYPIDDDNIGREHLWDNMPVLTNPEMIGAKTYEQMLEAGKRLVHGIMDQAQSLGMYTIVGFNPLEFPPEFSPLLQDSTEAIQVGKLTVSETGDMTNPQHIKLVEMAFDAYMSEFSKADLFDIHLPEHPYTDRMYLQCWSELDAKFKLEPEHSIQRMLTEAQNSGLGPEGTERSEREFKSTIAQLHFFDFLFANTNILQSAKDHKVDLAYSVFHAEQVAPMLHRVLWDGVTVIATMGYTSSRAVRVLESIERIDTEELNAILRITLQDDNIGWLPQVATNSIDLLLRTTQRHRWRGYTTRYWPIGDLDPFAAYLAKSSWDDTITPQLAYQDHFSHVYGEEAVFPMCHVMRLLEDITIILDIDFLTFLFPVPGIMKAYWRSEEPISRALVHIRQSYRVAKTLLQQLANFPNQTVRQENIAYWRARLTFSIEVLTEVEHLCRGGIALTKAKTNTESDEQRSVTEYVADARDCYQRGIAAAEAGLQAMAEVVRDDSDRGALVAYYHILVREVREQTAAHLEQFTKTSDSLSKNSRLKSCHPDSETLK